MYNVYEFESEQRVELSWPPMCIHVRVIDTEEFISFLRPLFPAVVDLVIKVLLYSAKN